MESDVNRSDVIAGTTVESYKQHWQQVQRELNDRAKSLRDELRLVKSQIQQIDGALQACDVLLQPRQSHEH